MCWILSFLPKHFWADICIQFKLDHNHLGPDEYCCSKPRALESGPKVERILKKPQRLLTVSAHKPFNKETEDWAPAFSHRIACQGQMDLWPWRFLYSYVCLPGSHGQTFFKSNTSTVINYSVCRMLVSQWKCGFFCVCVCVSWLRFFLLLVGFCFHLSYGPPWYKPDWTNRNSTLGYIESQQLG